MLSLLYDLQQLEAERRDISEEKTHSEELTQLRSVKAAFEVNKQRYQRLSAEIAALGEEQTQLPEQLAQMTQKRDAEQAAIFDGSVTSTKALTAREAQLASLEEHLREMEERLESLEGEIPRRQQEADALKEDMGRQYLSFRRLKESCQKTQAQREARLAELERRENELLPQIEATDLTWFRREQLRFNGTPIAKLSMEQVCSGCHTKVPPVVFTRTQRQQRTICDSCGRILFIDERDKME